jgi:hypothetical protein
VKFREGVWLLYAAQVVGNSAGSLVGFGMCCSLPADIDSNVCMSATTFADVPFWVGPLLKDTSNETPTIARTTDTIEINLFLFPRVVDSETSLASVARRVTTSASSDDRLLMWRSLDSNDL